jgi:hypothetical protein
MEKLLKLLSKLQREGVPLYVLIDGISPQAWIKVEKALNAVTEGEEIDVVIVSGGGTADESYKMIRAFRQKYKTVNVIVPFWAKSAATLFSFGASRIVLHSRGELGPIDAQIKKDNEKTLDGETSSALVAQSSLEQIEKRSREGLITMYTQLRNQNSSDEIVKIGRKQLADMLLDYSAKFYAPLIEKIDPTELGNMARTLNIGRMYARRILRQYNNDTPAEKVEDLLDFLVYECPDHGYVVDYDVLALFLPFVIKANEPPFTNEYYDNLGKLSLYLLENDWTTLNNFYTSLIPQNNLTNVTKTDNIKHDDNNTQQQEQSNTSQGGSSSRPTTNTNTQKPAGSGNQTDKKSN